VKVGHLRPAMTAPGLSPSDLKRALTAAI
jgi:hypothetical protein